MIYTSLAVLALSASTALSPLPKLVHLHPHPAQPDYRISLALHNDAPVFQDIRIAGHTYTIAPHQGLKIKALAGTVIYADSSTGQHHRGDKIAELDPTLDGHTLDIR